MAVYQKNISKNSKNDWEKKLSNFSIFTIFLSQELR